ncbi:Glycerophosphocholine phosphodiesterase, partial [Elasticomyces elasticus]
SGGLDTLVEELLDSGIDANVHDDTGITALGTAASNGHDSTVKLLLQHGADINLRNGDPRRSPIDAAARTGHLAVVRILLRSELPASLAASVTAYGNPLESAALSGELAVLLQETVNCNPDVNAISPCGYLGSDTALTGVVTISHDAMVHLLLSRGAEMNLVPLGPVDYDEQKCPLVCAVVLGDVTFLLQCSSRYAPGFDLERFNA